MKTSLRISSKLVQTVKVTVLTMFFISPILVKKILGFICNDMITTKYLWKDDIHLKDLSMSIVSKNFIEFVNNYLFSNFEDDF